MMNSHKFYELIFPLLAILGATFCGNKGYYVFGWAGAALGIVVGVMAGVVLALGLVAIVALARGELRKRR